MVGELLEQRLESHFHPEQTLGRADIARSTSRLWRLRSRTPGPPHLSRRRQRLLSRLQRNWPPPSARDRALANRGISPGLVSQSPYGSRPGDESLQRPPRPAFCPHAL